MEYLPPDGNVNNPQSFRPLSLRELAASHPNLHSPIIHGLLRECETMNCVAETVRRFDYQAVLNALSQHSANTRKVNVPKPTNGHLRPFTG